jgi:twitching motility protein PilU
MEFSLLLERAVAQSASDLFISADAPPLMKVDGQLRPLAGHLLNADENRKLIYSVLSAADIEEFERTLELNKSLHIPTVGRFRLNVYQQKGEPALVARYIKDRIPSLRALGLPQDLESVIMEERGLILVVGATGTGKSTTLASMLDYRNRTRSGHILTIEDPIEFIHKNRRSLFSQREVGIDTYKFEDALKNALRESPDVILIGEIRDRNTMKQALTFADTGHLCLATLHSTNATQALQRVLNFFPHDMHVQVLQDLSLSLRAIVSQRLCVARDGGRIAAVELMVQTPYIADLIANGKLIEIPEAIQRAKGRTCLTFDDALFNLTKQGRITQQEALRQADSRNDLSLRLEMEDFSGHGDYPTKRDITVDSTAPFLSYRTYNVRPMEVDATPGADLALLTRALGYAMEEKGLREHAQQPDLEVRFSFGMRNVKKLDLIPVNDSSRVLRHFRGGDTEHAMLIISVVDVRTDRQIYRVAALRRLPELNESEIAVNQQICELLSELPAVD